MAWAGVRLEVLRESQFAFLVYWLVFLILFVSAVYIALLDLRYIRVQRVIAERELFRETLADEEFRKVLLAGQDDARKSSKPANKR